MSSEKLLRESSSSRKLICLSVSCEGVKLRLLCTLSLIYLFIFYISLKG
jgi:hypothetical protein